MPTTEHFDTLIVGGGKAGKTLAADLARAGHAVVLVERGQIGGTCINTGCVPTKALVRAAEVADSAATAGRFGVRVEGTRTDMPGVLAFKRSVVAGMVDLNWKTLHGALGERFLLGEATFVAPRTVCVVPADGSAARHLSGDRVFVNVGSRPAMPAIEGLADASPFTSTSLLELDRLPEHLIIIGGGYVGVEFAQIYRRFGSRVTVVQRGSHLLPGEDPDASEAVEALLREDGVEVLTDAQVAAVEGRSGEAVRLSLRTPGGTRTVVGTDLLVATGRVPNTDGLGLPEAGVAVDARGVIVVNDRLETSAPQTWALGDCAGSPQQTHVALDDYRVVKANVFGNGHRTTAGRLIPHTVFIDPELGRVGLGERQARETGADVRVAKVAVASVPRARTLAQTRGFMKAVVDGSSDRILGFSMLGPHAGEVTAVVQTAMLGGLPFTALRDGVLAHPTMAEGLNYLFAGIRSS